MFDAADDLNLFEYKGRPGQADALSHVFTTSIIPWSPTKKRIVPQAFMPDCDTIGPQDEMDVIVLETKRNGGRRT